MANLISNGMELHRKNHCKFHESKIICPPNYSVKVSLLVTVLAHYSACYFLFQCQTIMDRMGDGPILPIIHTVTIETMLNNNGVNKGHWIKNVTCKQGLTFIY